MSWLFYLEFNYIFILLLLFLAISPSSLTGKSIFWYLITQGHSFYVTIVNLQSCNYLNHFKRCNGVFWSACAYLQFILLPKAGEARNLQISVAGGVFLPFLGQIKMHRHVLTDLFRQLHRKNAVMWCHPKDRTHPCCHSSGWEPGNVVFKINPSNTNNIHLIGWIVQSSERQKKKININRSVWNICQI